MSEKKISKVAIWLPVLIALSIVAGIVLGIAVSRRPQIVNSSLMLYPKSDKLNNVLKYIEEEYVDTVNSQSLSEDAIVAMLKKLDPHSAYIPASDLQAVNEPLEGNFSGIGVQFNLQNDTVVVINTIPNGPSALVGLLAGDRIVKVNDTIVAGVKWESDAIVKRLKGPRGTKVKVTIKRPGSTRMFDFDITRNTIPLYSVDVSYMLDDHTGYIKVNQFARTTPEEFTEGVTKLRNQGMISLILDLRGNGGGFLDAAIFLADQFLADGKLIVYTKGRSKPRDEAKATTSGICEKDKLIILVDEFSASASEIVAGAIQDNDRGIIMGRRSFGKGLVQEQVPLSDGSAIRLTVARYYTPTGRCIQKPYKNGVDDYYKDLSKRYQHGEFGHKDSIRFNDSLKFTTPAGKVVYGGGGIMPDIFIPIDTEGYTTYYNDVRDAGLLYRFAFVYSDGHRAKLKALTTLADLRAFMRKDNMFDKFIEFAKKQGFKPRAKELKVSHSLLNCQLEAYIARNFFDNEGFYPIIKDVDKTLTEALKEIEK